MSTFRSRTDDDVSHALALSSLPKASVERFVAGTRGEGLLLAHTPGLIWSTSQLSALGGFGVFCITSAFVVGFGSVDAQLSLAPARLGVFTVGMLALTLRVLLGKRRKKLVGSLPFVPGIYVFSHALIDARSATLKVQPLSGLIHAGTHQTSDGARCLSLRFSDGRGYDLPAHGLEIARFFEHKQLIERGQLEGSEHRTPLLDAPQQLRRAIVDDEPLQAMSWQVPVLWLVPLLASVLLSPAWIFARNHASDWVAISLATSRGDDEALAWLASYSRPQAERADEAWFSLALSSPDPSALSRYVHGGGHHSVTADKTRLDRLMRDGSVSALETYLRLGGPHRGEVFDELLRRGLTDRSTAALLAYERNKGPESALVRAAYLPCAEMLGPGGEALSVKALRSHFVFAEHPLRRETASRLLQARMDAKLAVMTAMPDLSQPDWQALLRAVRASSGELRVTFAPQPTAITHAATQPPAKGAVRAEFAKLLARPPQPIALSKPLLDKLQGLLLVELQAALDERFEPGMVALEPSNEQDTALPELVVSYRFEQDVRYLETDFTDVPLLVRLSLEGATERFSAHSKPMARFITHELAWAWKQCLQFGLSRGCELPLPLETPKLTQISEAPWAFHR